MYLAFTMKYRWSINYQFRDAEYSINPGAVAMREFNATNDIANFLFQWWNFNEKSTNTEQTYQYATAKIDDYVSTWTAAIKDPNPPHRTKACHTKRSRCDVSTVVGGLDFNQYSDVIMRMMASLITSVSIAYSTDCSGTDQRKHQSSASLAFVMRIHRSPVNSPHKGPVTRKCFHLMTSSWYDIYLSLYTTLNHLNIRWGAQACFIL